jgi:hypothetical protein
MNETNKEKAPTEDRIDRWIRFIERKERRKQLNKKLYDVEADRAGQPRRWWRKGEDDSPFGW